MRPACQRYVKPIRFYRKPGRGKTWVLGCRIRRMCDWEDGLCRLGVQVEIQGSPGLHFSIVSVPVPPVVGTRG